MVNVQVLIDYLVALNTSIYAHPKSPEFRLIYVLSVGVRDVARMNTFRGFIEAIKKLKEVPTPTPTPNLMALSCMCLHAIVSGIISHASFVYPNLANGKRHPQSECPEHCRKCLIDSGVSEYNDRDEKSSKQLCSSQDLGPGDQSDGWLQCQSGQSAGCYERWRYCPLRTRCLRNLD